MLDLLCRPVDLRQPIGVGMLHRTEPLQAVAGGITANAGITMSRLGLRTGVFSYVGNDTWGQVVRENFETNGVVTTQLLRHPVEPTSTTIVTIAEDGERSFFHCVGAPRSLDADSFLDFMTLWRDTRCLLLGYYSLLPKLEDCLPEVFSELRNVGCMTALDAAGDGGTMEPLQEILPQLDVWVPSLAEARNQTGLNDPEQMIDVYRKCGAPGVLGVKLGGDQGVLLSASRGNYVHVSSCQPPGEIIDTTGAGDCFYAGLLTGLLQGRSLRDAGTLGCAAAACCVTTLGGSTGGRSLGETLAIAGLTS